MEGSIVVLDLRSDCRNRFPFGSEFQFERLRHQADCARSMVAFELREVEGGIPRDKNSARETICFEGNPCPASISSYNKAMDAGSRKIGLRRRSAIVQTRHGSWPRFTRSMLTVTRDLA
jgi:hypothetical protein